MTTTKENEQITNAAREKIEKLYTTDSMGNVCVYVCSTKNGPLFIFTPFHIQDQHRKTARLCLCMCVYEERKKISAQF